MRYIPRVTTGLLVLVSLFMVQKTYAFPDVSLSHSNHAAIMFLTENGIIAGYPDGSFKPQNSINRAEFTKIVIEGIIGTPSEPTDNCFPDVSIDEWFAKYVCRAKQDGIISGYPDGTFGPANTINLVEALKIIVGAYKIPTEAAEPWYVPYVNIMSQSRYIPDSFKSLTQTVKRGEMAEVIWRVLENKKSEPFTTAQSLINTSCNTVPDDLSITVNMDTVRNQWLNWYNELRTADGLHPYTLNPQLNRTATLWAQAMRDQGQTTHKRFPNSDYYNYQEITDWYANLGVTFANVYRVTHSENIGAGFVNCSQSDCTASVIQDIRPTLDAYMAEKGKVSSPHYSSVMNKYFNEIGLGLAMAGSKLYIVTHYGTSITSNPLPICNATFSDNTFDESDYGYYRPQ